MLDLLSINFLTIGLLNQLSTTKRKLILKCLTEGNSLRSTQRITGVSINTVTQLLRRVGEACSDYQDKTLVNLQCEHVQLDELWSFCGCREKNKAQAKNPQQGDVWTWVAICVDSKIIPSWFVGDRSNRSAYAFCADLSKRLINPDLQITSDGHPAYQFAVKSNFGSDVNYARLLKIYGKDEQGNDICVGTEIKSASGNPDLSTKLARVLSSDRI